MKSKKVVEEGKLKPTIKILEDEIKKLKEEMAAKEEKIREEVIYNFFSKLNSEKYGYLMDAIASANYLFMQKKESGKEPNNTFLLFTNVFLSCCKDLGVEQILPIGKELVITKADAVKKYKYFGEPFKSNERKKVTVVFPGWKYKDRIISLPTVKEIK
jgi:hypothetical protein